VLRHHLNLSLRAYNQHVTASCARDKNAPPTVVFSGSGGCAHGTRYPGTSVSARDLRVSFSAMPTGDNVQGRASIPALDITQDALVADIGRENHLSHLTTAEADGPPASGVGRERHVIGPCREVGGSLISTRPDLPVQT
jgi:hypothetical protein